MTKDLCFYSNYCDFSKEILTLITKKNLRNNILLVCIDNGKYQIPPCITHVPSLLNAARDSIYIEDGLVKYLEEKAKTLYPQDENIQTFSWEGNNYSESYSFVNDDFNGNMTSKAFTMLEEAPQGGGGGKMKEGEDTTKPGKFDINKYDSYIASRNRDEEQIKKVLHRNNTYDRI